jgi:phosphatidylglycerophosphate synthase
MVMEAGKRQPMFMPGKNGARADGVYLTGTKDIVQVLQTLWSPESYPFPSIKGHHVIQGPPGLPCRAGADAQGMISPEAGLVRTLGRQTEADDGFMARHVDRRISRFFSRRLAHTAISPNQITIAGMTIGLVGAFFLSLPGYWTEVFGALLFVFCVVVDGVDGEVARLKLMETTFGHTLDIVTDNIVHVAVFVCISIGLYRYTGNPLYMRALLFLMGGFALCAVAVYCCILKRSPGEIRQSSRTFRVMALMANRDFAYLVLLFAAFHRIEWFLLASSAGTYLFAALLLVLRLLEFRPAAERG